MRLLLDSHAFLWFVANDRRLDATALEAIVDAERVFVSLATCWEFAIKAGIGKLRFPVRAAEFFSRESAVNGFDLLPIELAHIEAVESLPLHHRDPFDRLLIAQGLAEDLTLVSAETLFDRYGVKRIWG